MCSTLKLTSENDFPNIADFQLQPFLTSLKVDTVVVKYGEDFSSSESLNMLQKCYRPRLLQGFLPVAFPPLFCNDASRFSRHFGSALDNSQLNDSQPCFLTCLGIIMALAAVSYHSGTQLQNGEGRSGKQFTGKKRDKGQLKLNSIVTGLKAHLSKGWVSLKTLKRLVVLALGLPKPNTPKLHIFEKHLPGCRSFKMPNCCLHHKTNNFWKCHR